MNAQTSGQDMTGDQRAVLIASALKLRGEKSYSLIARELGVTREVVAGIFWRADGNKRVSGRGRHGGGKYPKETLRPPRYTAKLHLYMTPEMKAELERRATKAAISIGAIVRVAIAKATGSKRGSPVVTPPSNGG